jgi:polysaccharide export outer membrane protein
MKTLIAEDEVINHNIKRMTNTFFRKPSCLYFVIALGFLTFLNSCKSYKDIPYFKNVPDSTYVYKDGVHINTVDYEDIKILPNDILNITIQTIDPEMNNVMGSADANTTLVSSNSNNTENKQAPGYLVDQEGYIELPVAGKIKVGGLTTVQAKEQIRTRALKYYKEPVVNVRIVNFKVTVLGEVAKPGAYLINGEKATILDALGQSGDMTIFGKRGNVLLVREENGKQKMVRFNLNSTDIFESPYFYLKQGDVLYVQPGKGKAAANDAAMVRTYTIIASTLSLFAIILSRIEIK